MSPIERKIGNTTVPAIGFGAMGISTWYGAIQSDEERFKILDAAYELGCRHWDTADIYGDSEDLLGKWFKRTGKRNDIFLATKFGITMTGPRGDPEYVKQQFENSLKRLGVDHVDLLYAHRIDPKVPIEVTVRAMAEFVKAGKVKYLGLSECSSATIRRAHAVHPISAVQIELSPFALESFDPRIGVAQTATELDITIVAYSPLARGLLTGQYKSPDDFDADDFRRTIPKFSKENFPKILNVAEQLADIGRKHNATAGQVTIAWILARQPNIITIPGTKKVKYLTENWGANGVTLSAEEIAAVTKLAQEAEVSIPGDRYEAGHMPFTYGDTPAE